MTSPHEGAQPTSWRDVYALVRDTREDLLGAIGKVDGKVTRLATRVEAIEDDRATEKITREATAEAVAAIATSRNRRLATAIGATRGTLALVISAVAVVISALKS